jgi:LysM repeat protein
MPFVRQLGTGLIYGVISVLLVIGVLSLALAESYTSSHPTRTPEGTVGPSFLSPSQAAPALPSTGTALPILLPPASTQCPLPAGWILIQVQSGDTLSGLAIRYGTTTTLLERANCLLSSRLTVGSDIYVPILPAPTPVACRPFPGWIHAYIVQLGDTLFHIATLYGTTVANLKFANCKSGDQIFPGERLWVPNVPTMTPGMTIIPDFTTPTEIPTLPLTMTALPFTETIEPTMTSVPPSSTAVSSMTPAPSSTP